MMRSDQFNLFTAAALTGLLSRVSPSGTSETIHTAASLAIDAALQIDAILEASQKRYPKPRTPDDDHDYLQSVIKERDSLVLIIKDLTEAAIARDGVIEDLTINVDKLTVERDKAGIHIATLEAQVSHLHDVISISKLQQGG